MARLAHLRSSPASPMRCAMPSDRMVCCLRRACIEMPRSEAPRRLLEVAANSLASALAAQAGGAGRIELCTALELGGLTPSYGEIALVRERVQLPLYVLIRPRA